MAIQTTFTDGLGRITTTVIDVLTGQVQTVIPGWNQRWYGLRRDGRRVAETNQDSIVTDFGYERPLDA